jgi:hypothetical protein
VLLAFAFMGLGFYELSGGNDFDPEAARAALIEARQTREAARTNDASVQFAAAETAQAEPQPRTAPPEVTRAALNLVSFDTAVRGDAPVTAPQTAPDAVTETPDAPPPQVPLEELAANRTLSLASLDPASSATRSNAFAGSSVVASSAQVGGPQDIRVVKGSLVNMRSGPGTDYDVVDQLTQSTEVEVLSDSGNGWVELRPLDRGTTGWIAEFLLTAR